MNQIPESIIQDAFQKDKNQFRPISVTTISEKQYEKIESTTLEEPIVCAESEEEENDLKTCFEIMPRLKRSVRTIETLNVITKTE